MLTTELIRRGARLHGPRVAILFGEERLTFEEVDLLSNRLANVFVKELGLEAEDRVALLLDNSLWSVPLDFACAKARLMRVPLNSRLSLVEHRHMIEAVGARHLIHGASQSDRAGALGAELPELRLLALEDGLLDLARSASDNDPHLAAEPDDVILALFTSGTSGKLKAAQHTQASYAAITANILLNLVDPKPGDIMLHAASMIHASGTFVVPYWIRGGAAGVLPGFDPRGFLDAIERWRPAGLNMVPTMLQMLMEQPGIGDVDMTSVETIVYGASPMPRALMERALALWGPRFVQYYGQTEAPLVMAALAKEDHVPGSPRLLSCGRPALDCELRLVADDGSDVAPAQAGEIVVRAPFLTTGYYRDDALNEATFLRGGWLRTRDVGRFDDDGYLYLVDRTSDMIVTGGYNVYPREVEDVLLAHPAVREAAVVGIPDERWGEAVTAFVALREEAEEAALIAFARERLAGYKVPKSVRFIEAVPKSAVGKPLRRALRDPFWQGRERRI
jgi:acyl-CoA synthetase (AMP-forming)/AMP-acid ligase II